MEQPEGLSKGEVGRKCGQRGEGGQMTFGLGGHHIDLGLHKE